MKRTGIVFFIFIILLTVFFRFLFLTGPVSKSEGEKVYVKIDKGSTSHEIGELLYNKNIIKSPKMFDLLVSIYNLGNNLQAGYYELNSSYPLGKVIDYLVQGRVATFKITIPEGFKAEEIAARYAARTRYSRDEFLKVIKNGNFTVDFLPDENIDYKYRLEGFLYPDTYIIPLGYSPAEMLEVPLNQFEKKWLPLVNQSKMSKDFSVYDIITIASLIESEARLDEEKPLIAAVIYNRLKKDMFLQIDASVQYILEKRKVRILYSDLEIESPYNTYLNKGLPVGPICSPGARAIEAALKPADVDYTFYFALSDGSHMFSDSYYEHLKLQKQVKEAR